MNWLKVAKFYKVILFWWHYFGTHPFPGHIHSLDDLVGFGRKHRVMGFSGQCIRAYVLWNVFQHFGCTSFIETGSGHGHTTGYVRRIFRTVVLSCEVNTASYLIARLNLLWAKQVLVSRSNSPDFLRRVRRESQIGNNPMVYLDAHGYEYIPLRDELRIIAEHYEKVVVVIDDFFVPSDPRFGYDQYPSLRIDSRVIDEALRARREDAVVYLPSYDPSLEGELGGAARGMAVVLVGQQNKVPTEIFPFNLLAPV